ncbi:MAG: hypothetical protein HGA45_03695 [Chloroflexales bacterium]|nr:hypothetical protein [Chloroflexales bacterium]
MRQFTSRMEFDRVMEALEAFALEDFVAQGLSSGSFSLAPEAITWTPEDIDDEPYDYYDDDDDERGLRSQTIGIQYERQPVGSFTVREQDEDETIVALTVSDVPDAPQECRSFLIAWSRTFREYLGQLLAPPAPRTAGEVIHERELADDGQGDTGVIVVPASIMERDLLDIITALKQLQLALPTGASADAYIRFYYLSNIREEGSNIGRDHRTSWEEVQKIFDANNPGKMRAPGVDPSRTLRDKQKTKFDHQYPGFKKALNHLKKLSSRHVKL